MNLELYIEKLVLDGVAVGSRRRITKVVEQELTRLLTEQGVPNGLQQGAQIPHVDGGVFQVAENAKPEVIGVQVAQSIYGGLNQGSSEPRL
ncbi:MAG: hypothetical protein AAF757_00225 [Cyanobacteria bacterium P01_D01_bin.116]